jgi:hypothetical protein
VQLLGRLPAEEVRGLHQKQEPIARVLAEPIEDLQELELIEQIVLKPQHHPVEARHMHKSTIARRQVRFDPRKLAPAPAGKIARANGRQLSEVVRQRHRPVMQHVPPREHLSRQSCGGAIRRRHHHW